MRRSSRSREGLGWNESELMQVLPPYGSWNQIKVWNELGVRIDFQKILWYNNEKKKVRMGGLFGENGG